MHGGIEHDALRLPAYGGGLFDPDRYPFLEGRPPDTRWRARAAHPLPVDDRTMLHLLDALQTLEQGSARVLLSYEALDVEQIGHVYEGLLDHVPAGDGHRAGCLAASAGLSWPGELEAWAADRSDTLVRAARQGVRPLRERLGKALDTELLTSSARGCGRRAATIDALLDRVAALPALVRDDLAAIRS